MDLEAIKQFVGVPVSVQLKGPLANHGSSEEVQLSETDVCGRAALVEQDGKVQPLTVWSGAINSVSSVGLVLDTLGYAGAPLRIFIPYDMIAGVFFAVRHAEPARIVS